MNQYEAYTILGIREYAAKKEDVKRAYRELCKQLHPDDNPTEEALDRYLKVQEAYAWVMEHNCYMTDTIRPYVFGEMQKQTAGQGKVIGGWKTTDPQYTQQQYRKMMSKKLDEERKKKIKEDEERKQKIWEAMQKAHKLPSEREAEKWKKIETRREAERIAALIRQLMSLEDLE